MADGRLGGVKRPPVDLAIDRVPSPLGTLLLVWDGDARLRSLDFAGFEPRMRRLLGHRHGERGFRLTDGRAPADIVGRLDAFFSGELAAIDGIAVATGGTEFRRAVWTALRSIPAGATISYGELASAIGRPRACRAVGAANGANPIAIVVPCHRVVGSDDSLTGYGGGLERKRWLLAHEREHASASLTASLRD